MNKIINKTNRGFLISIEGIDGSGKSTLAKRLKERLENKNLGVLLTQEPGGTPLGRDLRTILHERKKDVCDKSEYLLFAADRAQHFESVVIPALKKNTIIISDRLADSSTAYQGYGRGLDIKTIESINKWAMSGITPDLTLYIKLDFKEAIKRITTRGDKLTAFEKEKELFFKRASDGFDKIFKDRTNVVYLDGKKTIDELVNKSEQEILKIL